MDWVDSIYPSGGPTGPFEREEPRRFKKGDRVRVNDFDENVDKYLQKDNRIGTIIYVTSAEDYWLRMEKPVISDGLESRPAVILKGYSYWAGSSELELIESRKFQVGDEVRVKSKSIRPESWECAVKYFNKNDIGYITKIKGDPYRKSDDYNCIVVDRLPDSDIGDYFAPQDLELIEPAETKSAETDLERHRKNVKEAVKKGVKKIVEEKAADEVKFEAFMLKLKNLTQTALDLIEDIEKAFKDSQKYPIFGLNLKNQKSVIKTQKFDLDESLLSVGVILYHIFTGQSEYNNHGFLLDGYSKPEDMPEEFWKVVNKLLKGEYRSLGEFKKDIEHYKKFFKAER